MLRIIVALLIFMPVQAFASNACSLTQLSGKWMTTKSNAYWGTNTRCSMTVATSGSTFTGTCYDRYRSSKSTAGGTTSSSYAASSGKITQVSSINSCLFTFTATMGTSTKISGDFVLSQDNYTAHGYFFKDASDYESGPFTAIKVP